MAPSKHVNIGRHQDTDLVDGMDAFLVACLMWSADSTHPGKPRCIQVNRHTHAKHTEMNKVPLHFLRVNQSIQIVLFWYIEIW